MSRRTLRGRVSALGLLVIAGWLFVLTAVFNVLLAARLRADLDSALRTRASTAAATLALDGAGRVVVRESASDQALDTGVWVYAAGTAVDRPPATPIQQQAVDAFVHGTTTRRFVDGPRSLRMYALPVRQGRLRATIVAAASDGPSHRTRNEALVGSVVVAVLALAGAYVALRLTAGRALRPVGEMTRQAGEWSASALSERFDPDQRFVELESLSATLNGVLARQAATVRHERQLMAELSHELRTPLTRILAELDLLDGRETERDRTRLGQHAVRVAAERMVRIVDTLLSTERAGAPGRCEVAAAVDAAVAHRAPGTNIAVSVPNGLVVGADPAIVERVLAPLLDNAERHARGVVSVDAWRTADDVIITVSDDGPGVTDRLRESIFQPGVQGSRRDGAGLGLPLARRLARAATGDVTHVGGSAFEVRLPPG